MPLYYPSQGGRGSISSNTNYPPQSIKSAIIPFPNGWLYRSICTTIASEVTGATHTDYPLYVTIQDDLIKSVTETDGKDILFTDINNVTIPFLIEVFDRPAGIIKAWLKRTINNSTNVLTWLYIGNENATDAQQRTAVWDSNFKAVFLMADGNRDTNQTIKDETASPLDGTVAGATGLQTEAGLVGNAEQMGSTSFSYATLVSSTKLNVITGLTVEYIANKKTSSPEAAPMVFNKGAAVNLQYSVFWDGGTQPQINIRFADATLVGFDTSFSPTLNQNHYVAHTYDGVNVKGFVDAVKKQETAETRNIDVTTSVSQIGISGTALPWGPSNSIDLIRISNIARSEDFITTSNNNFFNPTVFTTKTPFVTSSVPENWFNESYKSRVLITIKAGQVPTTQTDFPFLFNSTLAALVGKVQSAGQDIRWVLPDKTVLKHEIQAITAGTGALITHTKIPSISNGTTFYLYFNNSGASDGQNVADVWTNGYKAVYHMNNANAPTDSTGNFDTTIPAGSTNSPLVAGKIGQAKNFVNNVIRRYLIPASLEFTGNNVTISSWVTDANPTETSSRSVVSGRFAGGSVIKFRIGKFSGAPPSAGFYNSGHVNITSPTTLDNALHYWTGTYDGANLKIYIDAIVKANLATTTNLPASTAGWNIGHRWDSETTADQSWNGIIDEVRISNSTRLPDWITAEYNNQNTPASFYDIGAVEEIT